MVGGEMKSFDTNQTGNGEGKPLCTSTFLSFKIEFKQKKFEFFCVEIYFQLRDQLEKKILIVSTITDVEGRRLRE